MFSRFASILLGDKFRIARKAVFWLIFTTLLVLTLTPKMISPVKISNIDKLYHFVAFAGFAFAFRIAYKCFNSLSIGIVSVLLGVLIEIAQSVIPNRGFSIADMVADAIGVLVGLSIAHWILNQKAGLN